MIETDRLRLRAGAPRDTAALVAHLNDWAIAQWLPAAPFPYREEDAQDFLSQHAAGDFSSAFIIALRGADQAIGVVSLTPAGQDRELGYWLARDHGGLGYMSKAVRALIRHLPDHAPDVALVFATTDPQNAASQSVLMRCGFDQTGTHRRQTPNRQGNRTVLRFERRISAAT